ncbi:MAG: hypothetical protein J0M23_04990 [Rickettsiales bacterium]|nr:hypothetical protein [Rickettsiales bacterium]
MGKKTRLQKQKNLENSEHKEESRDLSSMSEIVRKLLEIKTELQKPKGHKIHSGITNIVIESYNNEDQSKIIDYLLIEPYQIEGQYFAGNLLYHTLWVNNLKLASLLLQLVNILYNKGGINNAFGTDHGDISPLAVLIDNNSSDLPLLHRIVLQDTKYITDEQEKLEAQHQQNLLTITNLTNSNKKLSRQKLKELHQLENNNKEIDELLCELPKKISNLRNWKKMIEIITENLGISEEVILKLPTSDNNNVILYLKSEKGQNLITSLGIKDTNNFLLKYYKLFYPGLSLHVKTIEDVYALIEVNHPITLLRDGNKYRTLFSIYNTSFLEIDLFTKLFCREDAGVSKEYDEFLTRFREYLSAKQINDDNKGNHEEEKSTPYNAEVAIHALREIFKNNNVKYLDAKGSLTSVATLKVAISEHTAVSTVILQDPLFLQRLFYFKNFMMHYGYNNENAFSIAMDEFLRPGLKKIIQENVEHNAKSPLNHGILNNYQALNIYILLLKAFGIEGSVKIFHNEADLHLQFFFNIIESYISYLSQPNNAGMFLGLPLDEFSPVPDYKRMGILEEKVINLFVKLNSLQQNILPLLDIKIFNQVDPIIFLDKAKELIKKKAIHQENTDLFYDLYLKIMKTGFGTRILQNLLPEVAAEKVIDFETDLSFLFRSKNIIFQDQLLFKVILKNITKSQYEDYISIYLKNHVDIKNLGYFTEILISIFANQHEEHTEVLAKIIYELFNKDIDFLLDQQEIPDILTPLYEQLKQLNKEHYDPFIIREMSYPDEQLKGLIDRKDIENIKLLLKILRGETDNRDLIKAIDFFSDANNLALRLIELLVRFLQDDIVTPDIQHEVECVILEKGYKTLDARTKIIKKCHDLLLAAFEPLLIKLGKTFIDKDNINYLNHILIRINSKTLEYILPNIKTLLNSDEYRSDIQNLLLQFLLNPLPTAKSLYSPDKIKVIKDIFNLLAADATQEVQEQAVMYIKRYETAVRAQVIDESKDSMSIKKASGVENKIIQITNLLNSRLENGSQDSLESKLQPILGNTRNERYTKVINALLANYILQPLFLKLIENDCFEDTKFLIELTKARILFSQQVFVKDRDWVLDKKLLSNPTLILKVLEQSELFLAGKKDLIIFNTIIALSNKILEQSIICLVKNYIKGENLDFFIEKIREYYDSPIDYYVSLFKKNVSDIFFALNDKKKDGIIPLNKHEEFDKGIIDIIDNIDSFTRAKLFEYYFLRADDSMSKFLIEKLQKKVLCLKYIKKIIDKYKDSDLEEKKEEEFFKDIDNFLNEKLNDYYKLYKRDLIQENKYSDKQELNDVEQKDYINHAVNNLTNILLNRNVNDLKNILNLYNKKDSLVKISKLITTNDVFGTCSLEHAMFSSSKEKFQILINFLQPKEVFNWLMEFDNFIDNNTGCTRLSAIIKFNNGNGFMFKVIVDYLHQDKKLLELLLCSPIAIFESSAFMLMVKFGHYELVKSVLDSAREHRNYKLVKKLINTTDIFGNNSILIAKSVFPEIYKLIKSEYNIDLDQFLYQHTVLHYHNPYEFPDYTDINSDMMGEVD